jgi:hypothetical protein
MALAALAVCLCALAAAPAAPAATPGPPTANTGGAHNVSYGSALLTGSVNPNGIDTSYYFQYGVTHLLGNQTGIAGAGAGTKGVPVSLPVGGLQPLTLYHYRLVAVNGAGVSFGTEHTFLTTKIPLSLQIVAAPSPVLFGGSAVVEGTLSGTFNAGRTVVLQADAFPFTAGFVNVGNPELTNAAGGFSFPLLGVTTSSLYRVVTTTNPAVVSPSVGVSVAPLISSHVGRTSRAHHARFYGTVTPALDGMRVAIMRFVHGHGVLVGGAVLHHRDANSSKFSRVIPVGRGVYRIFVQVIGRGQVSGYGAPLVIR